MIELNINYNESCLDTLKRIESNTIDLILTSPPYDDLRTYNKQLNGNNDEFNGYSFPFEDIAKYLFKVLKKGGVLVWVIGDATVKGSETGTSFRQALFFKSCGFDLYDTMIYQKTGTPFPQKTRYNQIFEYMFVFSKGKPKTFNPIMKRNITAGAVRHSRKFRNEDGEMISGFNGKPIHEFGIENNIWVMRNGMYKSTKDVIAFQHPAIFPEELAIKHIISWSNEDEIVYDPFMGSGTVAKCSILLNRKWIGSETDATYHNLTLERIKNVKYDSSIYEQYNLKQ